MAVPKRRTSKTRKRERRSHLAKTATALTSCSRCGRPVKPHTICANCGYYRGRLVIDLEAKKED